MKAAYIFGPCPDFRVIKAYGFDTVIGCFTNEDLDKMYELNIGCIYAGAYTDHSAIIAYYLFDEPEYNHIPLEEQESRIAAFRALTNKPLAIACIEQFTRECSPNFDWYLLDIYYMTEIGRFRKIINYLNAAISTHAVRVLYPKKHLVPIMGVFDDSTEYRWSEDYAKNFLPFARKFRSYFRWTTDQAIFNFPGDVPVGPNAYSHGVLYREEFKLACCSLNHEEPERCWWITSKLLMGFARVLVWGRSILPESFVSWFKKKTGIK